MNNIKAKVIKIESLDGLNLVYFDFEGIKLTMMSLELSKDIQVGTVVILGVKPSHITIAKDLLGIISASNNFETIITNINQGKLLATINMQWKSNALETLITVNSLKRMNLKIGDTITTLIKAGELFIQRVNI